MRLTIVSDAWSPQINGAVTTLKKTVEILRARGYEVSVIEPSLFRTVYAEIKLTWNLWKLPAMIAATRPDRIHIFTEGPLGVAAKLWADHRKIIYTTSYHTRFREYCGNSVCYSFVKWFHKKSTGVMVSTIGMRRLLENAEFDNLVTWGRGVDVELFTPVGPVPDAYVGFARPILLNVGRVSKEKNLEEFYQLHIPGTKVQVGDGPMVAEYKEKYPDVKFLGAKSGAQLAEHYRGADVFVFPSVTDIFGIVMLESIASGVPVAAYDVTGPKDVIFDGITGSLGHDLRQCIQKAIRLETDTLRKWSLMQTWERCTDEFERAARLELK